MTDSLSSRLHVIGARLCKSDETKLDGRMVLALADEAAALESYRAEVHESAEALLIQLNDQLSATTDLVQKLTRRPKLAVDGSEANTPLSRAKASAPTQGSPE